MITDARSKGDLIATPHLESLFNARHLESVSDNSNRATCADPAIHSLQEHAAVRLRHRLAFVQNLAVSAQSLSIKSGMTKAASGDTHHADPSRAAVNVATWRSYLPEDCVVAMINDRWHWST
jgi:hypothetical protein